jgi:hypothetical protein
MNEVSGALYEHLELMDEDLQGWNSTAPIFAELIEEFRPETIIEVGTWKGASAIHMAKITKSLGLNTRIWCVDTWLGAEEFWCDQRQTPERNLLLKNGYPTIYYQFLSNVVHNKCEGIILPFPNTSSIGAIYFQKNNVRSSLIYIDGSHEESDVYRDLCDYWEILEKGGALFGDDFGPRWPGVMASVKRFSRKKWAKLRTSGVHWCIRKR